MFNKKSFDKCFICKFNCKYFSENECLTIKEFIGKEAYQNFKKNFGIEFADKTFIKGFLIEYDKLNDEILFSFYFFYY